MKPRVYGALLGLGLVGCATGCSAGIYGVAAGGGSSGPSQAVAVTATTRTPTLGIRVPGSSTLKPAWLPFYSTQLALAGHPHRSRGPVLLALETRHQAFGTKVLLVHEPRRGSRYEFSASVRGSANLRGRTVVLQLSVYDTHGRLVNFATSQHQLSSGWRPLSVRGRVPIADGHDLRVAIFVARPKGPPSWLEIRDVSATGASLTS